MAAAAAFWRGKPPGLELHASAGHRRKLQQRHPIDRTGFPSVPSARSVDNSRPRPLRRHGSLVSHRLRHLILVHVIRGDIDGVRRAFIAPAIVERVAHREAAGRDQCPAGGASGSDDVPAYRTLSRKKRCVESTGNSTCQSSASPSDVSPTFAGVTHTGNQPPSATVPFSTTCTSIPVAVFD